MKLFLFLMSLVLVSTAQAASFDCRQAQTEFEKTICSNHELNILDYELGNKYQLILADSSEKKKAAVIAEQKRWLSETRTLCKEATCLQQAYISRLLTLESGKETQVRFESDTDKTITKEFRDDLNQIGLQGKVTSCNYLLSLNYPSNNGRDSGFGAVCTINDGKNTRPLMLCDDFMVGKLTIRTSFTESLEDVARFTEQNCQPGG